MYKRQPAAAEGFSCPVVAEAPLSLLCRVTDVVPLGSHDMFLADIAAVLVDDALLNAAGRLDLAHAGLLAYAQMCIRDRAKSCPSARA